MRSWREGDPVGAGIVYLPDTKTKQAYERACKRLWIESAAQHVLSLPSLEQRRAFIAKHPADEREALKSKVKELWEAQK